MKTLSIIVLLALVLGVTAFAADASRPTLTYFVSPGKPCRLADATGTPTETINSKVRQSEPAENLIQMDCLGMLPDGAAVPGDPLKFYYDNSKIYCATLFGDNLVLTRNYGDLVSPDGTSWITCVFTIR